jgi:glycosyltransferase involved in cell wall biosynthesis
VCRILGIQGVVVYTPNGPPFMVGTNRASNYIYKKLEKFASAFGGQVVCCSPSEQKAYELAGISAITINNGIDYEKEICPPNKQQKDTIFRIVTSGRIVHQKNPVLFNKIASYFEEFKQFVFLWIGDGTNRHLLTAKNIQITGWLDKDEVNGIVTGADIYLSTSKFEGLPYAVLEALALRKPVLLTDCMGNKDLVVKGLNGDVFKNENEAINKIFQFYNNSSMLSIMGEHSGSHCNTFFNSFDTYQGYKMLYQKAAVLRKESVRLNQIEIAYGTR